MKRLYCTDLMNLICLGLGVTKKSLIYVPYLNQPIVSTIIKLPRTLFPVSLRGLGTLLTLGPLSALRSHFPRCTDRPLVPLRPRSSRYSTAAADCTAQGRRGLGFYLIARKEERKTWVLLQCLVTAKIYLLARVSEKLCQWLRV